MARAFNGSSQYIEATSTPVTAVPYTMSVWARPNALEKTQTALALGRATSALYAALGYLSSGKAFAEIRGSTTNAVPESSGSTAKEVWNHLALINGSTTSHIVLLNGTAGTTNTTNTGATAGMNRTTIGSLFQASTRSSYFNGQIAEAAIWNVALTTAEVAALAKGLHPFFVRPANLVFFCPVGGIATPEPELRASRSMAVTGATETLLVPPALQRGPASGLIVPVAPPDPVFPTNSNVLDAFNRAEAATLGSDWTKIAGLPWAGIKGEQAANTAESGNGGGAFTKAKYGPDTEVFVTAATIAASGYVGVWLRLQEPGAKWDGYYIEAGATSADTFIYRTLKEERVAIGPGISTPWASGDKLGASIIGNVIRVYRYPSGGSKWQLIGVRTDSTYSAAGYVGIWRSEPTTRLDDLSGGTVAAGQSISVTPATEADSAVKPTAQKRVASGLGSEADSALSPGQKTGQKVSAGISTEADTSPGAKATKRRTVTPTAEADSAPAPRATKRVTVTPATEASSAVAGRPTRRLSATAATEADTGRAAVGRHYRTATPASETDTAPAAVGRHYRTASPAAEADSAVSAPHTRRITVTPAVEASSAVSPSITKRRTATPAAETDVSRSPGRKIGITPAIEADAAVAVSHRRGISAPPATEADSARPVSATKRVLAPVTTETDSARTPGATRRKGVTPAAETDTARSPGRKLGATPAEEQDRAVDVTYKQAGAPINVAPAPEFDAAENPGATKRVTVSPALEISTARPGVPRRSVQAAPAASAESALPARATHRRLVTPAAETETALTGRAQKLVSAGRASEADLSIAATATHFKAAGIALEIDTAHSPGSPSEAAKAQYGAEGVGIIAGEGDGRTPLEATAGRLLGDASGVPAGDYDGHMATERKGEIR